MITRGPIGLPSNLIGGRLVSAGGGRMTLVHRCLRRSVYAVGTQSARLATTRSYRNAVHSTRVSGLNFGQGVALPYRNFSSTKITAIAYTRYHSQEKATQSRELGNASDIRSSNGEDLRKIQSPEEFKDSIPQLKNLKASDIQRLFALARREIWRLGGIIFADRNFPSSWYILTL